VVELLLKGKSNKQIALGLGISERTVEFHLNNVYKKMDVASRVELILKLGKTTGEDSANPKESTVDIDGKNLHNNNHPIRKQRWAKSWRNTVSLIKREVAMTIRISFEELENYLRRHPVVFSLVIFLTAILLTRYVVFELGLFHWASYVLLGVLLGSGSVYFGLSWKKVTGGGSRVRPLLYILISASLPLLAALFDQVYLQTVLRYKESTSVTIAGIYAKAGWLSSEGHSYLYRIRQTSSDDLWLWVSASMLLLFIMSLVASKRPEKDEMVTV
jgi:hypothetical protein